MKFYTIKNDKNTRILVKLLDYRYYSLETFFSLNTPSYLKMLKEKIEIIMENEDFAYVEYLEYRSINATKENTIVGIHFPDDDTYVNVDTKDLYMILKEYVTRHEEEFGNIGEYSNPRRLKTNYWDIQVYFQDEESRLAYDRYNSKKEEEEEKSSEEKDLDTKNTLRNYIKKVFNNYLKSLVNNLLNYLETINNIDLNSKKEELYFSYKKDEGSGNLNLCVKTEEDEITITWEPSVIELNEYYELDLPVCIDVVSKHHYKTSLEYNFETLSTEFTTTPTVITDENKHEYISYIIINGEIKENNEFNATLSTGNAKEVIKNPNVKLKSFAEIKKVLDDNKNKLIKLEFIENDISSNQNKTL